jgi:translation elongation factor EF-G
MQDYSIQLRSLTAGEGSFVVRPLGYEPAPPPVQAEVVRHRREALATARRS